MSSVKFHQKLIGIIFLLISSAAFAEQSSRDDSADIALSIHHAAVRQAESAVAVIREGKYDLETSDKEYEETYSAAIWEGIRLANPRASIGEQVRMAKIIGAARSLANASSSAAYGAYIYAGKSIDDRIKFLIQRDADDAFKLGYAQAIKRYADLSR